MSGAWREFLLQFGKHKGKTLAQVRVIDESYIRWLAELKPDGRIDYAIDAAKNCLEYIDRVDPFADNKRNLVRR